MAVNKSNTDIFCRTVSQRSDEHVKALSRVLDLPSQMFAILRQELDSLVRVIFILSMENLAERNAMINTFLNERRMVVTTAKNKSRKVTDREMVDLAQNLHGWTKSVYSFGCSFIHLSKAHDHSNDDPVNKITESEKAQIVNHLLHYHGGTITEDFTFSELLPYLPNVLDKISGNLKCYLDDLANEKQLDNL